MKKRGWMFLVLILLVLPLTFAQPIFTNVEAETPGLQISFPNIEFYPDDTNLTFNFHAFNSSNFFLDTDLFGVTCKIHIYDNKGTHIIDSKLTFDSADGDFKYISTREELPIGIYSYLANCNSSIIQEAGFISSSFEITDDGLNSPLINSSLPLVLGIIAMLIIFIIIGIMLENIYMKLISLLFIFGLDILLWATMLKIAEDILKLPSMINLMNAGWPYIMYSHLVFIGLIILFLIYELFIKLGEINKAKY